MRSQSGVGQLTRAFGALALLTVFASAARPARAQQCIGDCSGTRQVGIADLIVGVNIALDNQPISVCPAFDNGSGRVTIDVLITAVRNALESCPPEFTPTATPSASASATRTATATSAATATATVTATPTTTATPADTATETLTPTVTATATSPPMLARASKSSAIAIADDESVVALVNPDSGTLSVFAADTALRLAEVPTGGQPSAVVIHPNNTSAFVANRADATVVRVDAIDTQNPTVSDPLAVGAEPTGLALAPSGRILFVAEWAEGRVAAIDTDTMTVLGAVEGLRSPRAVAVTNDDDGVDGDEALLVTEFYGEANPDPTGCAAGNPEVCDTGRIGRVLRFRVGDLGPLSPIVFQPIDSGFAPSTAPEDPTVMTAPNQLYAAAVQNGKVYVTSVSASPQPPIDFQANVFPVLYVGDLATGMEDRSNLGSANLARLVFDQIAPEEPRRFLQEIVDLAFDGDSNQAYVVSRAADTVQRLTFDPENGIVVGTDDVKQIDVAPECLNPIGIAVAPTLRRAYVNCWLTRRLGVIDLDAQALINAPQSAPLPTPGSAPDDIRLGARFFFTGRGRWSHDGAGFSSCGSCHPDGLSDDITWSFAAGPRQSTSLDGSFSHGAGPQRQRQFNWTGIFDEIHDFERNTRGVSGGLGAITVSPSGMCGDLAAEEPVALPADGLGLPVRVVQDSTPGICTTDWNKIEGFVKTIRPPRARRLLDPDAVARGAALFTGAGACHTCHAGPGFTAAHRFWMPSAINNDALMLAPFEPPTGDPFWSLNPFQISGEVLEPETAPAAPKEASCGLRDVGTFGVPGGTTATAALEQRANGMPAQGAGGFTIPALYGLSVSAPYFHHGQAASLADALADPLWVAHRTAGNPAFAPTDDEIADLVSYLYSIDADAAEPALRDGFDGCPPDFPTYVAHLDAPQEVSSVDSAATADAVLQLNADETALTYEVRIDGIDPAQITQAHLHAGPREFDGPVVLFLADGAPAEPVLKGTLTAADLMPNADVSVETFADFVRTLKAGDIYVNVHTMAHPNGEIRGQVQAPIALQATLSGAQEVPAVTTTAGGSATFELSADRSRLRYRVEVTDIPTDQILQAHLHVAPAGVNGPVALFLAHAQPALPLRGELTAADLIPNPDAGIIDFDDFVAALLGGNVYANLHTIVHPSGEVRGQVVGPQSFPAQLDGEQEVAPVATDASGRAHVTLNTEGTALRFALATTGIAPVQILQAHLHAAPRGFNGPVVLFLANGGFGLLRMGELHNDDLMPNPDAGIESFADFVTALRAGDVYANVHTEAHSSGEIRGQIGVPTTFLATLSGAQEVPPVDSDATGQARIVLAPDAQSMRVVLVTDLTAESITQAHIHVGPPGMNGDVAFFLSEASFGSPLQITLTAADFLAPPAAPTYEAFLAALRTQSTYVNIHTTDAPDGEIRGQVLAPLTFSGPLSGDQEVPPVDTMASGNGQVVITADRAQLRFALGVSNLSAAEIQQAHIHVGPPGENGPVTLFLANGGFSNLRLGTLTADDFLSSPDVPAFTDFLDALLDGGTYMNVHTATHGDGEIRGQLED